MLIKRFHIRLNRHYYNKDNQAAIIQFFKGQVNA